MRQATEQCKLLVLSSGGNTSLSDWRWITGAEKSGGTFTRISHLLHPSFPSGTRSVGCRSFSLTQYFDVYSKPDVQAERSAHQAAL
jgi:hypothetical protein